jgi:hypothetical protein
MNELKSNQEQYVKNYLRTLFRTAENLKLKYPEVNEHIKTIFDAELPWNIYVKIKNEFGVDENLHSTEELIAVVKELGPKEECPERIEEKIFRYEIVKKIPFRPGSLNEDGYSLLMQIGKAISKFNCELVIVSYPEGKYVEIRQAV